MPIIPTILDGQDIALSLTAPDAYVDVLSVNVVTGEVTSDWLPKAWKRPLEQIVAAENSVVPPLDRTALNYLGRLLDLAPMDDCILTASAVTTAPNVQTLRVTPIGGNPPSVVLVRLPHTIPGAFSLTDTATGLGPPVILSGDVIGPSNANQLVVFGPGAVTAGAQDRVPVVTTDTKGRVFTLSEAAILIGETQVVGLVPDLASKVPSSRQVLAGTGLVGGGPLTADVTVGMPAVGTPGTYGSSTAVPRFTTDDRGRVTGVVNTPITFPTPPAPTAVFASLVNTTATVPLSTTPVAIPFTVEEQNGITLSSSSRITVPSSGVYEFTFSPLIDRNQGGNAVEANMWLRRNGGAAVPNSNSQARFKDNGDRLFLFIAVTLRLAANDYVEWMMNSTDSQIRLLTIDAAGDVPRAPAAIASAKLIGS